MTRTNGRIKVVPWKSGKGANVMTENVLDGHLVCEVTKKSNPNFMDDAHFIARAFNHLDEEPEEKANDELTLRFHEIANIAAYLAYRLTFGLIDAKDVELAKRLEHLDIDFIKIIAGANVDNLPAAVKLAAEELPISIEEVTA